MSRRTTPIRSTRCSGVTWIKRMPFADARAAGKVVYCQDEVDAAFVKAVLVQSMPGPRTLKILYSPLHGVGASAVCPVLAGAGFDEVEVFGPHAEPNGDFPNVPNHVANPENSGRLRRHDRACAADRRRTDPRQRPRLRPAGLRGAEVAGRGCPLDHPHRQPVGLAVGRFPAERPGKLPAGLHPTTTWSKRW